MKEKVDVITFLSKPKFLPMCSSSYSVVCNDVLLKATHARIFPEGGPCTYAQGVKSSVKRTSKLNTAIRLSVLPVRSAWLRMVSVQVLTCVSSLKLLKYSTLL